MYSKEEKEICFSLIFALLNRSYVHVLWDIYREIEEIEVRVKRHIEPSCTLIWNGSGVDDRFYEKI